MTKKATKRTPSKKAASPKVSQEKPSAVVDKSIYGDIGPLTMSAPPGLEGMASEDIGGGFIAITMSQEDKDEFNARSNGGRQPVKEEPSDYEVHTDDYASIFWIQRRRTNPRYLSRATERMCRALKLKYDAQRGEFIRDVVQNSAQVTKVTASQEAMVRKEFEVSLKNLEGFLLKEILPRSMSYSSSIERAVQAAKMLMDDDQLKLDTRFIQMAHEDALTLKSMLHFMKSAGIPDTLSEHYVRGFISNKFDRVKGG